LHIESDRFCHGSLHSNPVELIEEFAPEDSQALLRDQREIGEPDGPLEGKSLRQHLAHVVPVSARIAFPNHDGPQELVGLLLGNPELLERLPVSGYLAEVFIQPDDHVLLSRSFCEAFEAIESVGQGLSACDH
jgi:hypothetical protein